MRRLLVPLLALCLVSPCFGQSAEVDALAEAFFAKDVKTMLQHLPPELADAFAKASPQKQQMIASRMMFRRQVEKEGTKFTRPESGPSLVVEPPVRGEEVERERIEISLDKKMSDGNETMLRFRMKSTRDEELSLGNAAAIIWMRYVDGEWRVYEIEGDGRSIKLDDPQFLASLTSGEGGKSSSK